MAGNCKTSDERRVLRCGGRKANKGKAGKTGGSTKARGVEIFSARAKATQRTPRDGNVEHGNETTASR